MPLPLTPQQWRCKAHDTSKAAMKIQLKADTEKRDLTAEELAEIDRLLADSGQYEAECRRAAAPDAERNGQSVDEYVGEMFGGRLAELHGRRPSRSTPTGPAGSPVPVLFDTAGRRLKLLGRGDSLAEFVRRGNNEEEDASPGRFLRGLLTGRTDGLSRVEMMALSGSSDTGGGYLMPTTISARFVDLARSASVLIRAGAQTLPMDAAELSIARQTGDPTATWRHEGVSVTASEPAFDRVTLRPRTCAAIVPATLEWAEDTPNSAQVVENALAQALGLALDRAGLIGTGSNAEPRGITNEPSITDITSVGANMGGDYQKITSAIGAIFGANFPGEAGALSLVLHPRDAESLDSLEDSTGQPLQPTPWAGAVRKFTTTSLPTNLGGGTNESIAVLGDFSQFLVGVRSSGVVIRVLEAGQATDLAGVTHNAASELKRLIVAHIRVDFVALRPTWFSKLSGILA